MLAIKIGQNVHYLDFVDSTSKLSFFTCFNDLVIDYLVFTKYNPTKIHRIRLFSKECRKGLFKCTDGSRILHTLLLVKHYNDMLNRQSSE